MNGAESLVRTLLAHGVDTHFANPGTSEMHLVEAIDGVDDARAILCLFEGVCTGAADGFGRMRGTPAATLLHLGAGLGNGIANLHNCRRAATPLINIVGDHAVHHVAYDAPLTSDIEAVAKPVSAWIRTARTSEGLGLDAVDAVRAALAPSPTPKGGIATLIVPADCAWGEGHSVDLDSAFSDSLTKRAVADDVIAAAAPRIDKHTVIFIDGNGLTEDGMRDAGRIARHTGCTLYTPTFPARVEAGPRIPLVNRLPYFPEQVLEAMAPYQRMMLIGAEAPVGFFAYRGLPSSLVPEGCEVVRVAHRHEDVAGALQNLVDALDAPEAPVVGDERPEPATGALNTLAIAKTVAALAPDDCIVSGDSGGGALAFPFMQESVRHSWLNLTGGSIGQGGPVAVGAAVACPERKVIALLGDGGAMYTIQYLWTAARENLDITTVIFANQQYNILDVEYRRLGINDVGAKAASLFDLSNPSLNWAQLAEAQGVRGVRVQTAEEFHAAFAEAMQTQGPMLIEALI